MKSEKKSIVVIIGIVLILGAVLYGLGVALVTATTIGVIWCGVVFLVFLGVISSIIYTIVDRIKEIKEEEKDDHSKY